LNRVVYLEFRKIHGVAHAGQGGRTDVRTARVPEVEEHQRAFQFGQRQGAAEGAVQGEVAAERIENRQRIRRRIRPGRPTHVHHHERCEHGQREQPGDPAPHAAISRLARSGSARQYG
jgi:hypothetical protein